LNLIEARGLRKTYGRVRALDDFQLTLAPGRILGLIGPNGSGKTTALKTFLGLCPLDGGEVKVLGRNPCRDRKGLMADVGYISDVGILPRWMRVHQLLRFVAGVHPTFDRQAAERALAETEVRLDARISSLSTGMAVQLHLSVIAAVGAQLLVLDEPTLGLDILYRQHFYDTLLQEGLAAERGILITTHEVREIEHLLTDVLFIHHGRTVLQSSMDELSARFCKVTTTPERAGALRALQPLHERASSSETQMIFDGVDHGTLADAGEVSQPTLPELFVALVGQS
jgi:ABC-2 type transport system ATP-binding protein